MKPKKPIMLRVPLHPPPTPAELAGKGLELGKMRKLSGREGGEEALIRARATMFWAPRIAREQPYTASGYWLFVCAKEVA